MPKKEWTSEERAAFAAKMKAARAKSKTPTEVTLPKEPTTAPELPQEAPPEPTDPGQPENPEIAKLTAMVLELQQNQLRSLQGQPAQNQNPGKIGTTERYSINIEDYPDPSERLSQEARLAQFAFKENFEVKYVCHPTRRYQTIDGIWFVEPQFDLELIRKMRDEETGELTDGRYVVCRGIFFEDPDAAVTVAREQGLNVDESNEAAFLNEMRYLRMRDWLLEAFYPPRSTAGSNRREMVIDGKLVDYYEVNSEKSESIPFGKLKSKV